VLPDLPLLPLLWRPGRLFLLASLRPLLGVPARVLLLLPAFLLLQGLCTVAGPSLGNPSLRPDNDDEQQRQ
jgi:hypothetical protein